MELSGLLSGADNIFKFLSIGGVLVFVLSIIYPLQKQQEIDIEIITYNKETELLNNEVSILYKNVKKFQILSKDKIDQAEELSHSKKGITDKQKLKSISTTIQELKDKYNTELKYLEKEKAEIDVKKICIKYNESKIKTLEGHSDSYKSYFNWLFYIGIIFGIIGLIGWSISTYNTETLKRKQINE